MVGTLITVWWAVGVGTALLLPPVRPAAVSGSAENAHLVDPQATPNVSKFTSPPHEHSTVEQEEDLMEEVSLSHSEDEFFPRGLESSESGADETVIQARATFTDTCKCGQKLTRIVGGHETHVSEYPWQVAVASIVTSKQFCGGALITDSHILTAAHCFTNMKAAELVVLLREHDLSTASETAVVLREVAEIRRHKNYDALTSNNDIAILKLASPVTVSTSLLPVCLPSSKRAKYNNKRAVVAGWGTLAAGGASPAVLQEVTVPVLPQKKCRRSTNYFPSEITNQMLCAGQEGLDSCQGDSGGPLVYRNKKGRYEQIGIVSWGKGCAEEGYPGVYTRVNRFLGWIENRTKDGVYCKGFKFPSFTTDREVNVTLY